MILTSPPSPKTMRTTPARLRTDPAQPQKIERDVEEAQAGDGGEVAEWGPAQRPDQRRQHRRGGEEAEHDNMAGSECLQHSPAGRED